MLPATGRLHGGIVGLGAWVEEGGERRPIVCRACGEAPVAVASKSHFSQPTADYLEAVGAGEHVSIGSSLKFCIVAEGGADIYPRLSPTSEWDTAAGHAVLLAAGGRVDGPDGSPLAYGKTAFLNRGFVATGGRAAPPIGPFLCRFLRRRGVAARGLEERSDFLTAQSNCAPRGEIGPVRINFAPNLAKAVAPQVVKLGAHRLNARHAKRRAHRLFECESAEQDRNAIRFVERRGELGDPARSGTRDSFG